MAGKGFWHRIPGSHGQRPAPPAEGHLLPVKLEAAAWLRAEPRAGAVPCRGSCDMNLQESSTDWGGLQALVHFVAETKGLSSGNQENIA